MITYSRTHPFDLATALNNEGSSCRGSFPHAYANMVGPFGGIIAAILLKAVLNHPQRQGEPVAVTVNFAGPMQDADYDVVATVSRTSRSTQHWMVILSQNNEELQAEEIVATATVFMAVRRDSWSGSDVGMPTVPKAQDVAVLDSSAYMAWVKNYQMRIIEGAIDLSGNSTEQESSLSRLWVRDNPPRLLDYASLLAISDCFFPRIYVRRQQKIPAGTVSMTTYFHGDETLLEKQGAQEVLAEASGVNYYKSYFEQNGKIWSVDGSLLATTHQIVYFKI